MSTTDERPAEQPVTGRHPVNVVHLVMGLAFLGLTGVWALVAGDVVTGGDVRWLLPVPWVLAGVIGLVAAAVAARRHGGDRVGRPGDGVRPGADADDPADDPATDPAAPSWER